MRRCVISLKSEKSVQLSSPASCDATLLSFLLSLFDLRFSWLIHGSELALKKLCDIKKTVELETNRTIEL